MPFQRQDALPDDFNDEIGRIARALSNHPNWTSERRRLYGELVTRLGDEAYLEFTGDCRDYHLQRKGESCLFVVPASQRGALRRFAGQRVRLVCGGGWDAYSGRTYWAKALATASAGDATSVSVGAP